MKRRDLYKIFLAGMVLLAIYLVASHANEYLKLWFVILWGAAAFLTILRAEVKDLPSGVWELHLPPALQLTISILVVVGAAFATDWGRLSFSSLLPWAYVGFALPSYRRGVAWGWSRLQSRFRNG